MITPEHLAELSYNNFVEILTKNPSDIRDEMSGGKAALLHATLGIAGEAGEIVDTIKKFVIYNQPVNRENLKEELGDLFFYFTNMMQELDFTLDEIISANREKLSIRYANGYSDAAAKARADKDE